MYPIKQNLLAITVGLLISRQGSLVFSQGDAYIELRGTRLNSLSVVALTDIGEQLAGPTTEPDTARGDALVCVTTLPGCCRGSDGISGGEGEWLFPGGQEVPGAMSSNMGIYRNRGTGFIRLNRQADSTEMTLGEYCCEIRTTTTNTETVCVRVVEGFLPTIPTSTAIGTPQTSAPVTTEESTSLFTSSTVLTETEISTLSFTTTTSPGTESPELQLSTCTATNNILVGIIVILFVTIVILIFAFATALCYIIRIKRNAGSFSTQEGFEMNTGQSTLTPDAANEVVLKENQAYGHFKRDHSELVIPEYEDVNDIVRQIDGGVQQLVNTETTETGNPVSPQTIETDTDMYETLPS